MSFREFLTLGIALLLPQLAGGIGALFTGPAITGWYATLVRPELAPPNWVFGPVWTVLYVLMGIALFLVYRRGLPVPGVRLALYLFLFQLALNTLWSFLFFGLERPGSALVEIIVLLISIIATTIAFSKVSRAAALLMVPYILWVIFALYLNYRFWVLN